MLLRFMLISFAIALCCSSTLSAQDQSGSIPVYFTLDKPGYVTLVIEDESGKRVRNLISETKLDAGQHCVYWDGYDDGLPSSPEEESPYIHKRVKSGTYRLRGLIHDGIKLRYEFSVYSPGNPPWRTEDGTGAWTADHCVVNDCLFLPAGSGSTYGNGADQMLLSSTVAESGYAMVWTDLDGNKYYGKSLEGWNGAKAIDRDTGINSYKRFYAYALFSGWMRGLMSDGKTEEIIKWTPKKSWPVIENWLFLDLTVRNGIAVISNSDNLDNIDESTGNLLIVDIRQKKILANHQLPTTRGVTFDRNNRLLAIVGNQLKSYKLDEQTGSISDEQVIISTGLEEPRKVLVHGDNILISDWGKSHQIKVFDVNGKLIRTIGKPGGPQIGKYDETRMDRPEGFDIDSQGKLWVAEFSYVPRRVSMWNFENGSFIRAIYGRPQYGGGGFLDPKDKTCFYYSENVSPERGGLLFRLDWQTGTAKLTHIYYRSLWPTREQAQSWDALYQGPKEPQSLFMNCEPMLQYANIYAPKYAYHVKGHRYMTNTGNLRFGDDGFLYIWNLDGVIAKPVSIIGMTWMAKNIFERTKDSANIKAKFEQTKGDVWVWCDLNGDGYMQADEFQITELGVSKPTILGYSIQPDLSVVCFSLDKGWIPAPKIDERGVPIYDLSKIASVAQQSTLRAHGGEGGLPVMGSDGNVILTPYGWETFTPIQGYKLGSELLWTYRYYDQNTLPQIPGQMVGGVMNIGSVVKPKTGEAGEIFCTNGQKGAVYLFTTDGLFLKTLGGDARITPLWRMKEWKRGMIIDDVSWEEECFQPSMTQTSDGEIYIVTGKEHLSILRLDGLDTVKRLSLGTFNVSAEQLSGFPEEFAEQPRSQLRKTISSFILGDAPKVDGKLDDWNVLPVSIWAKIDGRTSAAINISGDRLYVAYKTGDPNFLTNSATDIRYLFKNGGALDLMLGTKYDPGITIRSELDTGDIRLVVTKINGKPTAVLFRQIDPNAPESEKTNFESPIGKLIMDSVKDVSSQLEFAEENGNYEFSIPLTTLTPISLANLGIHPHHRGRWLIGDLGILRGNNGQTIQRIYWNNLDTAIVSDIPTEAQLKPLNWGLFRLFEFSQADIKPIEKPADVKPGLAYSYYESPDDLKDEGMLRQFFRSFDWLKQIPIAKGIVNKPSTEPRKRKDWYGLSFSGYLDVPKDGLYQIFIYGNDYARFTLGGVIVKEITEDADGILIPLKAGTYPMSIDYWQAFWEDILEVWWSSSEISLQNIPDKAWNY